MLSLVDTQCVTDNRSVAVQRRVNPVEEAGSCIASDIHLTNIMRGSLTPLYGTVLASPMVEASVTMLSDPNWKAAGFAGHIR